MKFFDKFITLDNKMTLDDEFWEYEGEPHIERRQEILRKYPEIKKLMGYDVRIAYIVLAEVVAQILMCWLLQDAPWSLIFVCAYCIGATLNHSLGSAIHEIGHNLAFGHSRPKANRLLSIFSNLPFGVPMAISYRKYHGAHHRYLGEETLDVDIPTRWEAYLFRYPITKIIWLIVHPVIHAFRPFIKSPQAINMWEVLNIIIQIIFDLFIIKIFGVKAISYLIGGTFIGHGFHPLAGHFISEHYLFKGTYATNSYYGFLNPLLFNVGYHVEHHDFPYIPCTRLPEVKRIASEYYDNLSYHTSWCNVLWEFVFNKNVGPQARSIGGYNTKADLKKKE